MKKSITLLLVFVMLFSVFASTSTITASAKTKIKLSKTSITLTLGKSKTIKLNGLTKKQAKKVKWKSANKKIATVSKGKITSKKVGTTKITATYKGKKYKCKVLVRPNFKKLYDKYCSPEVARVAGDNSYLSLESNPYQIDLDDYDENDEEYYNALEDSIYYYDLFEKSIKDIHKSLGLPNSLFERMLNTYNTEGRQTNYYKSKGFYVTWAFTSNYGGNLEVQYYLY